MNEWATNVDVASRENFLSFCAEFLLASVRVSIYVFRKMLVDY